MFVIIYLDDILIFTKTKEEHFKHIRQVLQKLKEEQLLINFKKHLLVQEQILYLGFVILANGLKMDPKKFKAILDWPTPKNVGEVRSFHNFLSFQKKIIRNFSVVGNAMTETMRGDIKDFKGTHGEDKSFEALKHKVVEFPIFSLLDFNKVFQVECDASGSAIGVVLSQEGEHIAFFGGKLNDEKRKYSIYHQEFYAIVQALKKWRHYLIPKEFVLYTNHKALQYLGNQHKLNSRHMKWVEYLHSFTFVIKHTIGITNRVVGALSKRCSLGWGCLF